VKQRAAVLGTGQTHHRSKRHDVSIAGLCREAADRALADANLSAGQIDAVVVGKAPDLFEGVMMPELYLADALGAVGKPLLRVHTAGSVGGATGIVAASLIQAGLHRRVLAVAFEKHQSPTRLWALSITPAVRDACASRRRRLLRAAHQVLHQAIRCAGSHRGDVAAKDRRNGARKTRTHTSGRPT